LGENFHGGNKEKKKRWRRGRKLDSAAGCLVAYL
jgi:hypothetical protein